MEQPSPTISLNIKITPNNNNNEREEEEKTKFSQFVHHRVEKLFVRPVSGRLFDSSFFCYSHDHNKTVRD
jgi:hypothetical protein